MQGTTINGYSIVSLIGRGGMAEVWKAQNSLGVSVAIKVLNANLSQDANIVERFKGEARIMAALKHKNIREVRDLANLTDGRPCIIMEYLEGADLSSRMKRGESFTNAQLEKWWNQLVSALNYTHEHGYIHRDIKPSNIFITNDGDVKLMDFGIAKNGIGDGTGTGSKMGTLMYMSPEQVNDVKRVSPKTDVYSLAVTFVHLVSGKTPYDSSSTEYSIMTSILNTPLDTSGLPAPWNEFLKPYLVKDSVQRADFKEMHLGMQGTCTQTPKPILMPMLDEGTIVDNGRTKIEDESPFEFKVTADLKKLSDFPAKGGQTPVYVKTNGEENLLFPPSSWISSSRPASVNGGKHLYILTIQKNKSSQSRAMTIKVVSKKDSLAREDFINIKQKGKKSRLWIWMIVALFVSLIICIIAFNKNKPTRNDYSTTQSTYKETTGNGHGRDVANTNVTLSKASGSIGGHDYVDLGLSVDWATCNLGASSPTEYGDYYAWGETKTKSTYSWGTYKYCRGSNKTLTKYCNSSEYGKVDNITKLQCLDDAATANWGSGWRTPTKVEFEELVNKCSWECTGNGYKVTGPNGNSIFLPAAGSYSGSELSNASYGYYTSSTLKSDIRAFDLVIVTDYYDYAVLSTTRYSGISVRPVHN